MSVLCDWTWISIFLCVLYLQTLELSSRDRQCIFYKTCCFQYIYREVSVRILSSLNKLRRITNKTKWDRMRNDRIRVSCEIQNITSWVQRRRTEWSEHISRMADERLVRKVRDRIPEGKRNWGRPMKRWRDALEWTGHRPTRREEEEITAWKTFLN